MKRMFYLSFCALFLTACQLVVSDQPIGIFVYQPEDAKWNGSWISDGEVLDIKVVDKKSGQIQIAWVEDAAKQLEFKSVSAYLRKGTNGTYISADDIPDEDLGGAFIWGRVENDGQKIVLWAPDFAGFEQAYHNNLFKAQLKKNEQGKVLSMKLNDDSEKLIQIIESHPQFFDWQKPMVLMRLLD